MKKSLGLCLVLTGILLLSGCSQKFEPTESTIFVTSKGVVKSAIMESFEKGYYNFEELSGEIESAVQTYCAGENEGAIVVESLTEADDMVTLQMQYANAEVYSEFNDMVLFSGTLSEAEAAGYSFSELYDLEGQLAELTAEEENTLKVIITEEEVCIQTSGKIKYVSDNVTTIDAKLARALEAGVEHPAFVVYK